QRNLRKCASFSAAVANCALMTSNIAQRRYDSRLPGAIGKTVAAVATAATAATGAQTPAPAAAVPRFTVEAFPPTLGVMKAVQLVAHGRPGTLELREVPDPKPGS